MSNKIMDNLRDRFLSEHPETLDDDLEDKFEIWLSKKTEESFSEEELAEIRN